MIYTQKIQHAIRFATKTHEGYQKQKRKGKDIPYITHPLTVGLILASANASEDVVIAGILHDTIEDSVPEKKVTKEMIIERFGANVAELVLSVTEQDKSLSWEERKREALEHIETFSHDSLLLKSADIIANNSELIDDYERHGEEIFTRFNAPKDKLIKQHLLTITAIITKWSESPLAEDLQSIARQIERMGDGFMSQNPARIIEHVNYNENMSLECPVCKWKGTPKESGWIEYYDDLFDVSCPNCEKMLLIVSYPLVKNEETVEDEESEVVFIPKISDNKSSKEDESDHVVEDVIDINPGGYEAYKKEEEKK